MVDGGGRGEGDLVSGFTLQRLTLLKHVLLVGLELCRQISRVKNVPRTSASCDAESLICVLERRAR